MSLSSKQLSFIHHSDAFLNIADGAVRSGKTHSALRRFARYAIKAPEGNLAIFAKTERTARANVVFPLKQMFEPGVINYIQGSGELYIFGKRCWVIGVNDISAEEKVRGMTLAGGYMNEVTLYPQEVFDQAIARSISIPGAQYFGDCNPDSPYHWLYTDYLTARHPKRYLKRWRFKLEDNPILPEDNVEMLKALYGPGTLFYRRNIDGEWVMAEGAIYQQFDERYHVVRGWPSSFSKVVIGADYGTATTTSFILLGLSTDDNKWYAIREYYHDAIARGRQKTDGEFAEDLATFIRGDGYPDPYGALYPTSIEVDPSAASFRLESKKQGISQIRLADNEVLAGIRVVSTALTQGMLYVHEVCENLRKEMTSYVWDEKAQERGEDKPLKLYDHAADALRYGCMRAIGKKGLQLVRTA